MLITTVVFILISVAGACPPWTTFNSSLGKCQCGENLGGVVHCDSATLKVSVLYCYCMTYNEDINTTLVGQCLNTCYSRTKWATCHSYDEITNKVDLLNNKTCGHFHRTGQLCGKCVQGYGPPVYSYSLKCVECSESHFRHNILKYIAVAFGPLTVFYLVVVLFKVSATSGSMVAFILANQIFALPVNIKRALEYKNGTGAVKALVSFAALWNLDVFRSLYTPFCIHPEMSPLQVLSLDYLVGVYPLFLIMLTCIAVSLHDRYSIVVFLWRPAYKFLNCFRGEWDIRGSLIQAFVTFLVLSYVKVLNVSIDLLTPVYLQTMEGKCLNHSYLYIDGEVTFFGKEHRPYGVLAIIMLTFYNVLPVLLLLIYPCRCFQKCLNCCKLRSHTLTIFMDAFQGSYHHHPRDCRYFAALYFFMRIIPRLLFALIRNEIFIPVTGLLFIMQATVMMFLRPHKKDIHNKMNVVFLLLLVGGSFIFTFHLYASALYMPARIRLISRIVTYFFNTFIVFFLVMYGTVLCLRKAFPKKSVSKILIKLYRIIIKKNPPSDENESLMPHRFYHSEEYSELI